MAGLIPHWPRNNTAGANRADVRRVPARPSSPADTSQFDHEAASRLQLVGRLSLVRRLSNNTGLQRSVDAMSRATSPMP